MSFHSPHLLWLLVPLLLLFSWELARHTARAATHWPNIARAWAGAFEVSLGAKHTTAETRPRLWLWFGLTLCLIALARPQWGLIEEQVFDQSREVLIAVDLSRSMLAADVKPSRLDRSKLLIQSLLDGLKGERVGLVLFAGTAFLQSPLSSDYEILREFLPAMNPDYLPEGGSNYKAMLETSIQAFGTSTADRYLIVLSDGESTDEDWKSLTDGLKQKGIRVIGLGVGTTAGSFITDAAGGFIKDERGAVVLSRLNSATLQELAQVTGGAYTDASAWVNLAGLLKKTVEAGRKGEFSEKNAARLMERYQWFLAPGVLLLLISFWAEFPVRPRERALPLGPTRGRSITQVTAALLIIFLVMAPSPSADAAEGSQDTLAKPLVTAVARLAENNALAASDCAELAQTTITYGQRVKTAQQHPAENVVRDALQAVDLGEKLERKAADWPHLRQELEALLKKEEPPPEDKKPQDQDKKKQDQTQKQEQQKDQSSQQDQQKSDQQKSDQSPPAEPPPAKDKDAFGNMQEQKNQPPEKKPTPPPPPPGTQKVGGQQDKKPDNQLQDPELAMPLQKLEQVRNQDSPAKLQQLMQGQPQKPKAKGKDW
ncbi:MAG: VWA domain-containing protein [Opitutaceae bacterium]|nr:VWA domain-containing protein [Opitutaceae bacterium]